MMGIYGKSWKPEAGPAVRVLPLPVSPAPLPAPLDPSAMPDIGGPGNWRPEHAPPLACRQCQRLQRGAYCAAMFNIPRDASQRPLLDEVHYCVYSYPMEEATDGEPA